MKKESKIYPNFGQALVITIMVLVILILFNWLSLTGLNKLSLLEDYFYVELVFVLSAFLLIPFVIYIQRRSQISFKSHFENVGFRYIIYAIILAFFISIINEAILNDPGRLFDGIFNGKIVSIHLKLIDINRVIALQLIHGILLAPFFEELLFRGIILKQFLKRYTPLVSVILSSLLFTLCHFRLDDIGALFLIGLGLGIMYWRTNSLSLAILAHSIVNLLDHFMISQIIIVSNIILLKYLIAIVFFTISTLIGYRSLKGKPG